MLVTTFPLFEKPKIHICLENPCSISAELSENVFSFHEFLYVVQGEWEIYLNGVSYCLKQDDLILLPAGYPHRKNFSSDEFDSFYLHVSMEGVCTNPSQKILSEPSEIGEEISIATITHCQQDYEIKKLLKQLSETFTRYIPCWEIFRESLFWLFLARVYMAQNHFFFSDENDLPHRAIHIINQNPQMFFTEKELADKLFVCTKTLNKHFRRLTGKTVYQFQMDSKLNAISNHLLTYPNHTLKEIAEQFGFCNEFHLSRVFKRKFDVSPARFRSHFLIR